MANLPEKSPGDRSALGGFASMEFECSLTAAEANKAAENYGEIHGNKPEQTIYLVGDEDPIRATVADLGTLNETILPTKLALVIPRASRSERGRRWLRKSTKITYQDRGEPI